MRIVWFLSVVAGLALYGWYGSQPVVRVEAEMARFDTTSYPPVPLDSVRFLGSFGGEDCAPFEILARLHVDGRLFNPSNEAVRRALRREGGRIGANAVSYTTPGREDIPVQGLLDRLWNDSEELEANRYNEKLAGRAAAFRCGVTRARQSAR